MPGEWYVRPHCGRLATNAFILVRGGLANPGNVAEAWLQPVKAAFQLR